MTRRSVAELYDALHGFESRYRRGTAYPVHKALQFDDPGIADIYDWIIATVAISANSRVLDAGCGVGFGTIRLAESNSGPVSGVSLSPAEIETAEKAAASSPARERLTFSTGSFDKPPGGPFDVITTVESLKHSRDLERTLNTLWGVLAPGGTIVIVEDCYSGPESDADARQLCEDWRLERLYRGQDIDAFPTGARCRVVSLDANLRLVTPIARVRGRLATIARALFGRSIPAPVAAAFRGGRCLESLYARGMMNYNAFIVDKPLDEQPA